MKINQFTIDFQKNMELLLSLSNFFEQKTIYEIERTRNSIMDVLNFVEGDPKVKLGLIKDKIKKISSIVNEIFDKIREKVNEYEELSFKKILRMKNSYKIYLKKFLE